jgi:hypothetical protein
MATSQNGWPVAETSGSNLLHSWVIPGTGRKLLMRKGSAGFLLTFWCLWFHEKIERIDNKVLDDWGWNFRPIRGSTSGFSNHASGTACDLNAPAHWLGKRGTFASWQYVKMRWCLRVRFRGTLRHGIDYQNRADEMHVEIDKPLSAVEKRARAMMDTPRGKRILEANPGQRQVILS